MVIGGELLFANNNIMTAVDMPMDRCVIYFINCFTSFYS